MRPSEPSDEQIIRWRARYYQRYLAATGSIIEEQLQRFLKGEKIDPGEYVFHPSPTGRAILVAFESNEYKMGWYAWRLGLYAPGGEVIKTYPELFSDNPHIFAWSPSGERYCIFADRIEVGLFIHGLAQDEYSAVAFPVEQGLPDAA